MNELREKIVQWAADREIFEKSTPEKQILKTIEEVEELDNAILAKDTAGIIDGIGDTVVTLIILAEMYDLDFEGCVNSAYQEIKDRTGSIIGGTFVKDKS